MIKQTVTFFFLSAAKLAYADVAVIDELGSEQIDSEDLETAYNSRNIKSILIKMPHQMLGNSPELIKNEIARQQNIGWITNVKESNYSAGGSGMSRITKTYCVTPKNAGIAVASHKHFNGLAFNFARPEYVIDMTRSDCWKVICDHFPSLRVNGKCNGI